MSLVGTYQCASLNSSFVVENANNANGSANGVFKMDGMIIPVTIHYHFENNVGPVTNLWFGGGNDNPNHYVGGAGLTNNSTYAEIILGFGWPTPGGVRTFSGSYVKVAE